MRKQITVPETLNDIVKRLAQHAKISESSVISFGIHLLSNRLASAQAIDEVHAFINDIKRFYKFYYIKSLPRGKKSKEVKKCVEKEDAHFVDFADVDTKEVKNA